MNTDDIVHGIWFCVVWAVGISAFFGLLFTRHYLSALILFPTLWLILSIIAMRHPKKNH